MENFKDYGLGASPSPHDERNWHISKLIGVSAEVPSEIELDISMIPVKNQNNVGSCVAHAISYIREYAEYKQRGKITQLSPGFVYGNRKVYNDYSENINMVGMFPLFALNNLLKFGIPDLQSFPHNYELPTIRNLILQNKDDLLNKAFPNRISGFARLNTISEVKVALKYIGLAMLVIPIYSSFYETGSDGKVKLPNPDKDRYIGGHAVTIYGISKDNEIEILNSWGSGWASNGKAVLPANYPISEMWSISDLILPTDTAKPNPNEDLENTVVNVLDRSTGNIVDGVIGLSKAIEIANKVEYTGHQITLYNANMVVLDEFVSPKPEDNNIYGNTMYTITYNNTTYKDSIFGSFEYVQGIAKNHGGSGQIRRWKDDKVWTF